MTTELEKQFFDTFGIEAKYEAHSCDGWGRTVEVKYFTDKKEADKFGIVISELEYPQITDKNYLELICLLNKLIEKKYGEYETFISFDCENLKEEILRECLLHREELKRKEQECEESKQENKELHSLVDLIKTDLMKSDMENDDLRVENDQLKAENETLFKAIEEVNKINKRLETENEILEKDKANLDVVKETLKVQFNKLTQTLAEIKELLLKTPTDSQEHYVNAKSAILQKINEVEE